MLSVARLAECEPDDPRFAAALVAAGLPACAGRGRGYVLADGLAFGIIDGEGADRLLRSVVVPASRRGTGAGTRLVDLLSLKAIELGAERLWLLTTTAADFFGRLGWTTVPRDAAPGAIRASDQFTEICPSSAALMMRELGR